MAGKKDILWGLIVLIVAIAGFINSYSIPVMGVVHPLAGTGIYARYMMTIFGILGFILILKGWRQKEVKETATIFAPVVIFSMALLILYVILMPLLGYVFATILFMFVMISSFRLYQFQKEDRPKGKLLLSMLLKILLISVFVTFALSEIFVRILAVRLP